VIKNAGCRSYWITFPDQPRAPLGMGVTALSLADAFALMEQRGYTFHKHGAVEVHEDVTVADLDQSHVVPNMGPIVFRGIWYPCLNIGLGASGATDE
jgi:hypothetical protein